MKKIILVLVIFASFFFIGCNKDEEEKVEYTIYFETNGGDNIESIIYSPDFELPIPIKEGYNFLGWFTDKELNEEFLNNVNTNLMLYAKWELKTFKVKIVNKETSDIIEVVTINYGDSINFDKYLLQGLNFISSDNEYENIKNDNDIICSFQNIQNSFVLEIKEKEIIMYLINPCVAAFYFEAKIMGENIEIDMMENGVFSINENNVLKIVYSESENIIENTKIAVISGNILNIDSILKTYGYYVDENFEASKTDMEIYFIK